MDAPSSLWPEGKLRAAQEAYYTNQTLANIPSNVETLKICVNTIKSIKYRYPNAFSQIESQRIDNEVGRAEELLRKLDATPIVKKKRSIFDKLSTLCHREEIKTNQKLVTDFLGAITPYNITLTAINSTAVRSKYPRTNGLYRQEWDDDAVNGRF